jgi:hypothetical protein
MTATKSMRLVMLLTATSILMMCTAPVKSMDTVNPESYKSPYQVQFKFPLAELMAPDQVPPRNDKRLEASVPYEEWNSRRVRKEFGKWGPGQRQYPTLENENRIPAEWKRERILAVAVSYIGLSYQHHHIPEWIPPAKSSNRECKKGLDCSNFSAWVYNYGLGIKPNSAIEKQAEQREIRSDDGLRAVQAETINNDNGDYDSLVHKLKTADLLYIRGRNQDKVTHVIMWVGDCGRAPDGTPLVIDSTGPEHKDSNGNTIPGGVQLRPFTKNSWYFKCFDHAHRLIHD